MTQYSVDKEAWSNIPVLLGTGAQAFIYRRVGPDATVEHLYERIDSMKRGYYNYYHNKMDMYDRPPLGRFIYVTDVRLMPYGFDIPKDEKGRIRMRLIEDEQSGEIVLYGQLMYLHDTVEEIHKVDATIDFIDPTMSRLRARMNN